MPTTTTDDPRILRAYLADHLQLGRTAHDLAMRVARREGSGDLAALMGEVAEEMRRHESLALAFLRQLGAAAPWVRLALGSLGERVGRLKPNGRVVAASPLAPVVELEVIQALLGMLERFWRALAHAGVARDPLVLERAEAAAALVPRLEDHRLARARTALRAPGAEA